MCGLIVIIRLLAGLALIRILLAIPDLLLGRGRPVLVAILGGGLADRGVPNARLSDEQDTDVGEESEKVDNVVERNVGPDAEDNTFGVGGLGGAPFDDDYKVGNEHAKGEGDGPGESALGRS